MNEIKNLMHHNHEPKAAVGAVFGSREEARKALAELHKAHYLKSWFGVTSVATDSHGDQTITAESGSGMFFSQNSMGLVDALVGHGIDADAACDLEADIEPGEAVVTVETGDRDPSEAIAILERNGGRTQLRGTFTFGGSASGRTEYAGSVRDEYDDRMRDEGMDEDLLEMPVWEEEVFYVRVGR
jgi:hypothetical protein